MLPSLKLAIACINPTGIVIIALAKQNKQRIIEVTHTNVGTRLVKPWVVFKKPLAVILLVAVQLIIGGLMDYGVLTINEPFASWF